MLGGKTIVRDGLDELRNWFNWNATQSPRLSASAENAPNTLAEDGKRLTYTVHLPNQITHSGMYIMAASWADESLGQFDSPCPKKTSESLIRPP
jgi:hypothetical protein